MRLQIVKGHARDFVIFNSLSFVQCKIYLNSVLIAFRCFWKLLVAVLLVNCRYVTGVDFHYDVTFAIHIEKLFWVIQ